MKTEEDLLDAELDRLGSHLDMREAVGENRLSGFDLEGYDAEILERLRLITDDPQIVPGITVTLRDASGAQKFRIVLGKGHFVKPEPGMPPTENAEGRYVRIGDGVYLIARVFEDCHPIPPAWVEPLRLFNLNKALRITATENGKTLCIFPWGQGPLDPLARSSSAAWSCGTRNPPVIRMLRIGAPSFRNCGKKPNYRIPDQQKIFHFSRKHPDKLLIIYNAENLSMISPNPGKMQNLPPAETGT